MAPSAPGAASLATAAFLAAVVFVSSAVASNPAKLSQLSPRIRRIPHCLVIGARKCGTRALLDFLSLHPLVRSARGEVHYFDRPDYGRLGLAWYRGRMPPSRADQLTLEKSPAYFVTRAAPRRVRLARKDMRLLLVLRDPVRRVISDYAQRLHRRAIQGRPPVSLESLVFQRHQSRNGANKRIDWRSPLVATSVYHRHLASWLAEFPRHQLHIVDGDRLAERPYDELQRVERFLGLPSRLRPEQFVYNASKGFYCARRDGGRSPLRCLGPGKGRRHPPVSPETLSRLQAYLRRHDAKLELLAKRRFKWMTDGAVADREKS